MTHTYDPMAPDADIAALLDAIIKSSYAAAGTTIVARVDHATFEVKRLFTMMTPDPKMNGEFDQYFDAEYIHLLSRSICSIATAIAPARTWTGSSWSIPDEEFVTVVCRDADAEVNRQERQFHYGWRFSNHGCNAFDGEIFVVTPAGWEGLYSRSSGTWPVLEVHNWGSRPC